MVTALECIYIGVLSIYIMGAIVSLICWKRDKMSNILSNSINLFASICGMFFSICFLFYNTIFKYNSSSKSFSGVIDLVINSNIKSLSIHFRIDNLSAFFILAISVLSFIVSIYSLGYLKQYYGKRNLGYFGFMYNLFIASMIMVVSAGHLFFFLIVWEVMSIVSYFLVVYENEKIETQKAGIMYVVMTHIGTAFIIAAFVLIYKYTGADLSTIDGSKIPDFIKNIIFILTFIGFGTKAGMIPLHVWLPLAHPAAPSNISALMSGVMIKIGVYGIIRIVLGVLGAQYVWWGTVILIIGAVSTILGIAYAFMEINIKRLLAYSSVENMGIILIGVGLSFMAYSKESYFIAALAMTAALLHIFNHSVFKGLLFLGAGSIHYSTKTKNMEKLGGLIKRMPVTAALFLVAALSISSLPPLNGFVSEWMTYQSLFANIGLHAEWIKIILILSAAIIAIAGVLTAASFIKAYGISFLAMPRTANAKEAKEVPKLMLVGMAIPAVICAVIGVFPIIFIKIIDLVNQQMLHTTILQKASGFSSFVTFPIKPDRISISPITLVIIAAIIIPIVFYFIAFIKVKTNTRKVGTWDCGFRQLNSKMQYSATGFSKPLRIIFRAIFKPQRELELEEGSTSYYFKSAKYIVSIQSIFEKYLYEPVVKSLIRFARKTKYVIQTGSIHTYLIYIFIAMIVMLIYYVNA